MRLKEVGTPFKSITNGTMIGFKNLIVCLKTQVQFILFVRGNIQECIKDYSQMLFRFKQELRGEIKKNLVIVKSGQTKHLIYGLLRKLMSSFLNNTQ